jgi:hypothetical protein
MRYQNWKSRMCHTLWRGLLERPPGLAVSDGAMSATGTFRKYTEFLQRRDERTFVWSAQRYTLTRMYGPAVRRKRLFEMARLVLR